MDKWNEPTKTVTILIPPDKAKKLQEFLDGKGEDNLGTIETFTAKFDENTEIDIKVCQGDPPFVDAVLFIDGCDAGCSEARDTLLGEYVFGDKTVIVKENPPKLTCKNCPYRDSLCANGYCMIANTYDRGGEDYGRIVNLKAKTEKALDELARYLQEHEAENQIPDQNVCRAYNILTNS